MEIGRIAVAEGLDVLIDEIRPCRGRAPRIVDPAAEKDGKRDPGERRAPCLEAAALEVELEQDPWIEVTDLRTGDEQRLAGRRPLGADEQRVRHREARRRRCRQPGRQEARGIDHDVPHLGLPGRASEPAGHSDTGFGVVALAEVLPHAPAHLGAHLGLEQRQKLRAPDLVTASCAEHGADESADGDNVVARPARRAEDRPSCTAR